MRARGFLVLLGLGLAGCGEDPVAPPDPAIPPPTLAHWGSHGSGPGQFYQPTALAVGSDGSVYVEDNQNRRIQKFANDGEYLLSWGDEPGAPVALSYLLTGIAVSGDRVYVSDLGTAGIHIYTEDGAYLETWDYLSVASGLAAFPDGDLLVSGFKVLARGFVVDLLGPYVWRLDSEGEEVARWELPISQVTTDLDGNFYGLTARYPDQYPRGFIFKFSPEGRVLDRFSVDTESTFYDAVAVDSRGYVYAANRPNGSIYKFAPTGEFLVGWSAVSDEAPNLGWPSGLALDGRNNLFVSDLDEDRVVKYGGY